jgi:hypothetical protein
MAITYQDLLRLAQSTQGTERLGQAINTADINAHPAYDWTLPDGRTFSGGNGSYTIQNGRDKNGASLFDTYTPDGQIYQDSYKNQNDWFDAAVPLAIAAMGGMALSGVGAAGAGASGAGAGAGAAGGYAIPTAAELSAAGFGSGGMGMSGLGGIGSVSSGAGAGAGAAGYGSALAGLGGLGGAGVGAPAGASGAAGGGGGGLLGQLGDMAGSKIGSSLLGAAIGGLNGKNSPDNLTSTNQQNIDPRMSSILYGSDGKGGFISDILNAGNQPQKAGSSLFGQGADNYLGKFGATDFEGMRGAANDLMGSNVSAPQMAGAQVNAPSQNNMNLSPAYQDMIYGEAGNNPYLTGGIQKGINQANTAFQNMQTDATRNLTENILPSIRSGAQVNGQYGGSRQALSEGRALNDYSTQIGRAMSQVGQNNTDSAIAARAGAYNTDRSNALAAMGNLSGNQYNTSNTNAGLQQQANQANMQSQINTNSLNSANKATGINAQSGLLGQAYGYGSNNDMYGLNKIGKTSGLLGQYTGLGGSSTQSQPLYQNTMGNILGGATAGLGLYNAYKNLGSGAEGNNISSWKNSIFDNGGF